MSSTATAILPNTTPSGLIPVCAAPVPNPVATVTAAAAAAIVPSLVPSLVPSARKDTSRTVESARPVAAAAVAPAPTGVRTTQLPSGAGAGPTITVVHNGPSSKASKSKKKKVAPTVTMATASSAQNSGQGAQGENTGRWTAEEHRLFLQGLEKYGKGWKKIACLIKSRTVVQIRTHAQKYFQKLAKARQNGEEGDVSMDARGGVVVPIANTSTAQSNKRRRQTSGTKRKAIQSVVSSAQRQGKRMLSEQLAQGVKNPRAPLPAVAPALAPYVHSPMPVHPTHHAANSLPCVPSITTAQGTISGPALEDSLFRFLTPAQVAATEPQLNDVARQAGAHPITLPSDQPAISPSMFGGDISPTGVTELALYPSWTDAKDTPSWYAKGSDVDALLDVAESLDCDWLTDSGDLHETYQPAAVVASTVAHPVGQDVVATAAAMVAHEAQPNMEHSVSEHNLDLNALEAVDSNGDVVVPPLPSLFEGDCDGTSADETDFSDAAKLGLTVSTSATSIDEHLHVFDTPLEEEDFVSTLLEDDGEGTPCLPALG